MGEIDKQNAAILAKREGANEPLEFYPARWDRWRSVRIALPQGEVGLATATYSYNLTQDERTEVARRMAALWTLAAREGWTTDEIEASAAALSNQGQSQ